MTYPNVTSLYLATALAFNAPDGKILLGPSILRNIMYGGQIMAKVRSWRRNIAESFNLRD